MAWKQWLRPTNGRVRGLVGCLLVGLFCIQCIPTGQRDRGNTLIAMDQSPDPKDAAEKLVHWAKTDHIALLKHCREHCIRQVRDYTCTLVKQERIKGALGQEQEVQVKFMNSPFSVAMKWVRNAPIANRMLYVEGKFNNKMIVRPKSGLLRILTGGSVFRDPEGADVRKNTLRPVTMFGFDRGMRELLKVYTAAKKAGDLEEKFGGYADVAGRKVLVLERYLPAKDDYPARKTIICIDPEYLVPVYIEGFDWDDRLSSRYTYKDIRFNVDLTEDDFLPEANGIETPKKKP